jgi:hypothetical protein
MANTPPEPPLRHATFVAYGPGTMVLTVAVRIPGCGMMDDTREDHVMKYSEDAARLADRVVETVIREGDTGPWFPPLMVRDEIGGVPVLLGVVDVNPDAADDLAENPHRTPAEAWFAGWFELVEEMRSAYLEQAHNNTPSLRLVIFSDALFGGVRPHDEPHQPFRLDWLVGGKMVDHSAKLLWTHGRELLPWLTRSVVVPGTARRDTPAGVKIPEGVGLFTSTCSWSNVAVGFGGVDVAVWALAGVRDPRRLIHDTGDDGALSEVVELADLELYGSDPNELSPPASNHGPGGAAR